MKTPDEIKKGLECCMFGHCSYCPYSAEIGCDCSEHLGNDVREFHQQLESQNAELLTKVKQLETKCHQLERERDAAVKDISMGSRCTACRKFFKNGGDCSGGVYCLPLRFEWRGVKED